MLVARKVRCCVANAFLTVSKVTWARSRIKITKMSKKRTFWKKVPGVNGLKIPKVRTETARKSSYFNGSRLFDDIPNELEDINSVMIFKARILEFYESQAS